VFGKGSLDGKWWSTPSSRSIDSKSPRKGFGLPCSDRGSCPNNYLDIGMVDSPSMGLEEEFEWTWATYTRAINMEHIRLIDREDEMVWASDPLRVYSPKMVYI
jgi:hypothetical protein